MSWCRVFRLRLQCLRLKDHYDAHVRVELLLKTDCGYPKDAGVVICLMQRHNMPVKRIQIFLYWHTHDFGKTPIDKSNISNS